MLVILINLSTILIFFFNILKVFCRHASPLVYPKSFQNFIKISIIRNTESFCCYKYKDRFPSCCWHCSFPIGGKNRQNFGHPVLMSLGARMLFLYKWLSLHLPRNILSPRQNNNYIKSILSPLKCCLRSYFSC